MDDVIVVGGGIVGASAAYHLARAGVRVRLVDADVEGAATAAGAGIISPGTVMVRDDQPAAGFLPLAFRAGAYYPELHALLAEDGELDTGFGAVGSLTVAADESEASRMPLVLERMRERRAAGVALLGDVSFVDAAVARELFPLLTERMAGGAIYASGAARVDGRLLLGALRRAAERRGAVITRGRAELDVTAKHVNDVRVGNDYYPTGHVLIAAGAWTAEFNLPVEPERGQIAHFTLDRDVSRWPTLVSFTDTGYVVSFAPNRIAAGATREPGVGFDPRLTGSGVATVLAGALRVVPALADATLRELRVGLRPVTPDRLPLIGGVPGLDNVFVCAGHGHFGLMLGPYSGALVADMLRGLPTDIDPRPFAVERFVQA